MTKSHIDHSSKPISLFRLYRHITLSILFANRSIISVVTYTVESFERKLFILIFISDEADNDVVVSNEDDLDVEVKSALLWQRITVKELVRGPLQFLHLIC